VDNKQIFEFLTRKLDSGKRCVLVTVLAVEGSSMRDPGAHMGVCEDGESVGSLSGGCIEAAVVAEGLEALKAGSARITRFGRGSRYLDIKLPCGGGLDIHFQPLLDADLVKKCRNAIAQRNPFSLQLFADGKAPNFMAEWRTTSWPEESSVATVGHWPAPKLLIIGHGAALSSLAKQASAMYLDVQVLTPDAEQTARLENQGIAVTTLATPRDVAAVKSDPWTAIIFLFHDHDWEAHLMAYALTQPHFHFGAMGGRRAHEFRSGELAKLHVSQDKIDTIHAPIGLFHSSRDPDSLALSALAQVIKAYQNYDFAGSHG
jgi:xanthine dehydrogenase accessory factor